MNFKKLLIVFISVILIVFLCSCGNMVTLYAHMSSRSVKKGDVVKKGQQLGLVGSTGYSTGPHLHFEIIKNGKYVDPMTHFK